MQITNCQLNSPLYRKRMQQPSFAAKPIFISLSSKDVDILSGELGTTTSKIKILHREIGNFLCRAEQEGRKFIDKAFGEEEKVEIKLTGNGLKIKGDTKTIKLPINCGDPTEQIIKNIDTELKKH